jgi:hypothetical protein
MKLLIQSAMVFFGTLIAAALVALAGPGRVELVTGQEPITALKSVAQLLASNQPSDTRGITAQRPVR